MEGLLEILGKVGFDWQVALANLVNFLIIFFVLKKLAFKPIGKMIEARNEKINRGLEDAQAYQNLLKETEIKYAEALDKAKLEADLIIKDAKKEALLQKDTLIQNTKKEVNEMIENGKKSLITEKQKMLDEAKKEIIILVTKTTEKVLSGKIDSTLNQNLTAELKELK